MAAGGLKRRTLAFSREDDVPVQQDEVGQKEDKNECQGSAEKLSEKERSWRIYVIYFIGFMDLFGVSMMVPLFPKLIRNFGASPFLAGLIGSLYGALQVFSGPAMGKVSDIHGRKTMLLASYIGPAVCYFATGISGSLLVLVLARIPTGMLKHGLSTGKAYLTDVAKTEDRQSVLGMYNAVSNFGFIFGPLLGGYLADWDPSFRLNLITGGTIFVLNFFLVALLVPPVHIELEKKDKTNEPLQNTSSTWLSLRQMFSSMNFFKGIHWREFYDIILLQFLMTFALIIFRTNFPVFLEFHFHVDYKMLGKVISFTGVASAVASATVGKISKLYSNHQTQLIHFTILLAVSVTLISLSTNLALAFIFLLPLSLSTSNLRICMLSLQLQRAREDEKGAIIGLSNSINSVSRMLAPTIVGLAQEHSSEMAGYISSGLAVLAVVVMATYQFEKPK